MNDEELIEHFEREGITLATIAKRAFAYTVDEIIVAILFMLAYWGQFQNSMTTEQTIILMNSMFMQVILLKVVYHFFFVWMYGATLGKMAFKIRVISIQEVATPNITQALIRSFMRVVSESIFYLGFIWAMLNPKRETWHDKVAKTLVVNV